jgi:hypothetical protein
MTISRRAKFVRWLTSSYMQKLDMVNVPVETARRHLETIARTLLVRAVGVPVEASQLAGIDVDWLRPKRARTSFSCTCMAARMFSAAVARIGSW